MATLRYGWVDKVEDGDTFRLRNGYYIRLAGVEASERGTSYSRIAMQKLEGLILGKRIMYRQVGTSYNRIVAHVWADSLNINDEMTRYINLLK